MKSRETFLFVGLAVLLILNSSAYSYNQVIDLGAVRYIDSNGSYSINDSGQIAGYDFIGSYQRRAFLLDSSNGDRKNLGTLGGYNSGGASSINNSGQVVGWSHSISGGEHACLFDSTGGGANIDLGGGNWSLANSINNHGQIVGLASGSGSRHACLFDSTGGGANIVLDPLGYDGEAFSINNNGQIVGYSGQHAYIFDSTGGGANIDLVGGYGSLAHSINDNFQIVGLANDRACLFDPTGGGNNIDLGTLDGYDHSFASSISNTGLIVGYVSNSLWYRWGFQNEFADGRACLFDPTGNGNNIDLNTLIDPTSGWILTQASSVNNNGWITGYGYDASGDQHAFLLTPEPATLLILGLGGLILRRRK